MKIRWFDRLLLVIASLFIILEGAIVAYLAVNGGSSIIEAYLDVIYGRIINQIIVCVAAVVLIAIGLKLLFLRGKRPVKTDMIFMCSTDSGNIRIMPDAIEAIVQRAARNNNFVRDLKTKVVPAENALHVQLRVIISPGALVKDVSLDLQKIVKEELESNTGIPVPEVQVIIEAAPAAPAARVDA